MLGSHLSLHCCFNALALHWAISSGFLLIRTYSTLTFPTCLSFFPDRLQTRLFEVILLEDVGQLCLLSNLLSFLLCVQRKYTWPEVEDMRRPLNRRSCSHIRWRISFPASPTALPAPRLGVSTISPSSLSFIISCCMILSSFVRVERRGISKWNHKITRQNLQRHVYIWWFCTA